MGAVIPNNEAIRSIVRHVLDLTDFPERSTLVAQAETLTYISGPITFMRLRVDSSCQAARHVPSPIPSQPSVYTASGEAIGGLLVWLSDEGYIDALEYHWVTDEPPTMLPQLDSLRVM
jgi:hypothetical protein